MTDQTDRRQLLIDLRCVTMQRDEVTAERDALRAELSELRKKADLWRYRLLVAGVIAPAPSHPPEETA